MRTPLLTALLVAVRLSAAPAQFEITVQSEQTPDAGQRYVATMPEGNFSFVVPAGWTAQVDPLARTVKLNFGDLGALFRVEFLPNNPSEILNQTSLKHAAEERYPKSGLDREFEASTSDAKGFALELRHIAAKVIRYRTRLAQVQYPTGRVEFCLTAPAEVMAKCDPSWTSLLKSFKAEAPAAKPVGTLSALK